MKREYQQRIKRVLSVLLTVVVLLTTSGFGNISIKASAAEVCTHMHDENCGYKADVDGQTCTHTCEYCEDDTDMDNSLYNIDPLREEDVDTDENEEDGEQTSERTEIKYEKLEGYTFSINLNIELSEDLKDIYDSIEDITDYPTSDATSKNITGVKVYCGAQSEDAACETPDNCEIVVSGENGTIGGIPVYIRENTGSLATGGEGTGEYISDMKYYVEIPVPNEEDMYCVEYSSEGSGKYISEVVIAKNQSGFEWTASFTTPEEKIILSRQKDYDNDIISLGRTTFSNFSLRTTSLYLSSSESGIAAVSGKLKNGSFEEGQTWEGNYKTQSQSAIPSWNTTASDGQIELFRENTTIYIPSVTLKPSDDTYAAELNANEESTLYQNVETTPSSIYEWGLDHGARNGTDTMALVIGPKQAVDPSKPSKTGRDQLMQMVDWLIEKGKTSVKDKDHTGMGEHLIVYSKKFDVNGAFQDNADNNAFSLTRSSIYTEEWHVWVMADNKATSGTNPWGKYGSNAEESEGSTPSSGSTVIDTNKYYFYTIPSGQTETLFGFVSVGFNEPATTEDKAKTYGNFLDNINFEIFHPLSGSSTLHGSGVVGGSDGTTSGTGGLNSGYTVTVDNKLITYAVDGEPLKVQAIVKQSDVAAGCEFVGLYYTRQDENGELVTNFLPKVGHEIEDTGSLTDEEKKDKWIKSTNSDGDIIYTYYLDKITTATDLHFVFIKSPTVTYDPNGGKAYEVERTHNTDEAENVYSFKPVSYTDEGGNNKFTYISPYTSQAAEGQNDGWKFMGWLLTGDIVDNIPADTAQVNADQLGTLLLPAVHTIACDFRGESTRKEQYLKIWDKGIAKPDQKQTTDDTTYTQWTTTDSTATLSYANIHKGLTMVAQWRWRQAFLPQRKDGEAYEDSDTGGTVEITSVTDTSDPNYSGTYNTNGGKAYYATTDEIVTVEATAKTGYEFEGWYDVNDNLLSTQPVYSFTETKEKVGTYYARFSGTVKQTYIRQVKTGDTLTVIDGEAENSVGNLDRYSYTDVPGKDISATATAGTGYKCIGWYDSTGNKVDSTMLRNDGTTISYTTTGDATYYARFEKTVKQTFIRQVKNGTEWTTTYDNNVGTLNNYSHEDVVGATATSTVTTSTGYKFLGWYDSAGNKVASTMLSDSGKTISYTTTGDATYYARFEKKVTQTFIRQVKNGNEWDATTEDSAGTLTRYSHTDVAGKSVSSTANAGTGYEFVGWYNESGTVVADVMLSSDKKTIQYTTSGDAKYYARFKKIMVNQTYKRQVKNGNGWDDTTDNHVGTLSRYSLTTEYGSEAGSTVTVGTGYEFVGWYKEIIGGEIEKTTETTLSYTATENATYIARFKKIMVNQTYRRQVKNGASWDDTTDDSVGTLSTYTLTTEYGNEAGSTATQGAGYEFVGWYDANGTAVPENMLGTERNILSYSATENATYIARFSRKTVVGEPDTPGEPGTPGESDTPGEPSTPGETDTPGEPGISGETSTPVEVNTSEVGGTPKELDIPNLFDGQQGPNEHDSPSTGDESKLMLWTALLLLSLAVLAGWFVSRKMANPRKKKRRRRKARRK